MKQTVRIRRGTIKMLVALAAFAFAGVAGAVEWNDGTYTWSYEENSDGSVSLFKSLAAAAISPKPTGAFEIPSKINGKTLKEISTSAFRNCTDMTAVTLPSSVTKIVHARRLPSDENRELCVLRLRRSDGMARSPAVERGIA